MLTQRQAEINEINESWDSSNYADTWGLCILDNIKFQAKKTSLSGDNNLLINSKQAGEEKGEPPNFESDSISQTKIDKNGPLPTKIKIDGFVYPDKDSKGKIIKNLRSKINELRKICTDFDNPANPGHFTHQLVIPLYKTFFVKIDKYDIRADPNEWGFAEFELTCYLVTQDADKQGWLYSDRPTKKEVKTKISNWKDKIKYKFETAMLIATLVMDAAKELKTIIEQKIAQVTGFINSATAWVQNVIELADITGIVNALSGTISSLIYAPAALASSWIQVLDGFKSIKNIYTDNADLWKSLYEGSEGDVEVAYSRTFDEYTQGVSYSNMIDEYIGGEDEDVNPRFKTIDDVNSAKKDIDEKFWDLVSNYDYSYEELIALKELRSATIEYLNSIDIKATEEIVINQFTPSTVVSYLRYGNLDHAENITVLNEDNLFLKGIIKNA